MIGGPSLDHINRLNLFSKIMEKQEQKATDEKRITRFELNFKGLFSGNSNSRSLQVKAAVLYKNLSLIMAGMYDGLNCYSAASVERKTGYEGNKSDKRPIWYGVVAQTFESCKIRRFPAPVAQLDRAPAF